jgi:diguanylate cyclase (GGDEF)-like protein
MARAELTFIRKDKEHFTGEVTSAIFQNEGTAWSAMIIRDISDTKRIEKELRKAHEDISLLADIDDLTKALNRRAFVLALEKEMLRACREMRSLSLILMDLDHFKQVNDLYGHQVGDQMLNGFAQYLLKNLRPNDILGRYGGDEFIICLPDTTLEQGVKIAERLRRGSAEASIGLDTCSVRLTASFGVVCCDFASSESATSIIKRVDQAMYRAKAKRDCVSSETAVPGIRTPAQ